MADKVTSRSVIQTFQLSWFDYDCMKHYYSATSKIYDEDNLQTWKSMCLKCRQCNVARCLMKPVKCCFSSYSSLISFFLTCGPTVIGKSCCGVPAKQGFFSFLSFSTGVNVCIFVLLFLNSHV